MPKRTHRIKEQTAPGAPPEGERPAPELPPLATEATHGGNGGAPAETRALGPPTGAVSPSTPTLRQLLSGITLESAFYAAVLLASFALRLAALGDRPLAEHEAAAAAGAFQFLHGSSAATVGSPLLFNFNLLLFALAGANDTTARLIPALLGSSVVLLPLLVRREIGRTAAAVAALLLLASCSLVLFARDLNGVEVSTVAAFAAVFWLFHYLRGQRSRELYLAAVAGAVALVSGAPAFTVLLGALLFALFPGRSRRLAPEVQPASFDGGRGDEPESPEEQSGSASGFAPRDTSGEVPRALLLFAASYLVLSTALLMNRGGLGASFNLFGEWLGQFGHLGPLTMPLNLLLIYEPLVLVFGLAGLFVVPTLAARQETGTPVLIATTGLLPLLLYSFSGDKSPANMVVAVVPLALLAGWFIGNLVENSVREIRQAGGSRALVWGELPIFVLALVLAPLIYLQLTSFLQRSSFSPGVEAFHQLIAPGTAAGAFEPAALLLLIITLVLAALFALLSLGSIGPTRTANLAAILLVVLLALSGLRALSLVNFPAGFPQRELLLADQTSPQARDLLADLEWESEWLTTGQRSIKVQADEALSPVVRWYLRDMPYVDYLREPGSAGGAEALVTGPGANSPAGAWISQLYQIGIDWQLRDATRAQLVKWLVLREGGDLTAQSVRLWVPQPE